MDELDTIAVIPARGGSKTIPNKNLQLINGHSLVEWAVEACKQTNIIDEIYLSSDSDQILNHVQEKKVVSLKRPSELASDDSLIYKTVKNVIKQIRDISGREDFILTLIEPTCPFRIPQDISKCASKIKYEYFDSVATFTQTEPSVDRIWKLVDGRLDPLVETNNPWNRRQENIQSYKLSGGCYALRAGKFFNTNSPSLLFGRRTHTMMPAFRSIDIDTRFDLTIARLLANKYGLYPPLLENEIPKLN
jgi:N-acylneuraminate cytidylyltransferase